jgi:hypothetical protein
VVTTFYFYDDLTLREIGGALTFTEGRISQILHQALAKLRETLSEHPQPSEDGNSSRRSDTLVLTSARSERRLRLALEVSDATSYL